MKKYIDAELKVVRMGSDILTSSVGVGADITTGQSVQGDAPTRRSIWN